LAAPAILEEEDEDMADTDSIDANPDILHKRTDMEIDGAENQTSTSHVAGDKMRKI
jgi:hypothetical protein